MSKEFKNNFKAFFDYVVTLPNYENRETLKLTVDRINNKRGYQRGNLQWATRKQQANNRRNNV
jgi:hypothetical protein